MAMLRTIMKKGTRETKKRGKRGKNIIFYIFDNNLINGNTIEPPHLLPKGGGEVGKLEKGGITVRAKYCRKYVSLAWYS